MRLVSFTRPDGSAGYGTTDGTHVLDAAAALGSRYRDLVEVIAADAIGELEGLGEALPLADVTLLPPVTTPEKILCIGLNYLPHILETGRAKPEKPTIFTRYPDSLVGHGEAIVRPSASPKHDYEGELAIIIGKPGRHIAEADAWDHIAGYSCFNDGSIRDYQNHTTQFWPGKNFEKSGSFGPWMVTPDEVGDILGQTMRTRVNGNVEQETPISDMAIGIPELIAYASTVTTLKPGDVIATGTPGGVGAHRKPQLFLEPGMTVEVEITGVGTLRNGVIAEEG
ncbi:fumarylacetoacetate hydrolase family protein [Roseibacterium sp. SDUM158017]|uniref:fumarylacetoacetate hydrolase family protein n=1 Tax=Roseicyclus salinarum TaxID=3036773 RepID=UPI0024157EF7|nr:fumarylacetoacetate hydrolase family protein [Roseibacterium sp. SDUM158017]MDG4647379.1 fumarylacetoacetate hydrolase family protein [Roseibacterium sp. SDUM158017]